MGNFSNFFADPSRAALKVDIAPIEAPQLDSHVRPAPADNGGGDSILPEKKSNLTKYLMYGGIGLAVLVVGFIVVKKFNK